MDIKKLREEMNFTQEQLARELNVSVSTVQKWEQGRTKPSNLAEIQIEKLHRANQ